MRRNDWTILRSSGSEPPDRTAAPATVIQIAVLGAAVLAAFAWKAAEGAMHPSPAAFPWSLDDYPSLSPEPVVIRSRTGVTLTGRFFRGESGATIVLSHGYGGSQDEMLPVAQALYSNGFNVITYDLRGCGNSGGAVTLGALEQEDLRSVIDHVAALPGVDATRLGALGFSMGAATTILEAADDRRIRAVVDDSGWADVRHWLKPRFRDLVLHPRTPFSPLSLKVLEWRTGVRLSRLRPVDALDRLAPRPIFMIHGMADEVVPPADIELKRAAAGTSPEVWRLEDARHGDTVRPGGATSSDRVARFFERSLSH